MSTVHPATLQTQHHTADRADLLAAATPPPITTPAPDTVPLPPTPHPSPEPLTDPQPPDISDPTPPGGEPAPA